MATERWRPPVQPIAITQVGLALGDVLGQKEVEQRVQAQVELIEATVAGDVLHDPLVVTGEVAQLALIVRVRQEAHVEGEVLLAWRTVLEAEAHERERQPTRVLTRQQLVGDAAAQHRRRHAGGVDHKVRA